jgi:DNA-binding MarR family transcriptional regulator
MDTHMESEAGFDLSQSPGQLLHRAQQFAAERFAAALKAAAITHRQFSVLAALEGRDGASQADLVKATGIDRSTLADMVARMEANGLVQREKSEDDGRANSVSMTEAGKAALVSALPGARSADADVLAVVPKSKREAFMGLLALFVSAGDAPVEPSVAKPEKKAKKSDKADAKKKAKKTDGKKKKKK